MYNKTLSVTVKAAAPGNRAVMLATGLPDTADTRLRTAHGRHLLVTDTKNRNPTDVRLLAVGHVHLNDADPAHQNDAGRVVANMTVVGRPREPALQCVHAVTPLLTTIPVTEKSVENTPGLAHQALPRPTNSQNDL